MGTIKIEDLHKSFGSNDVLKGIDLDFKSQGITAVLGPNSSGKTTLIKTILGMVIPDSGSIFINGSDIKKNWSYRKQIGYLPQIARFPENLKVSELLSMMKNLRDEKCDEDYWIDFFELQPFLNKRLANLSGGTRQKVNITQAFMFDSPILILDEPTAGLDPVSRIKFKEKLFEEKMKGKQILVTTHIMNLVEDIADDLIFILEGKIHYRGHPTHLKNSFHTKDFEKAIARMVSGSTGDKADHPDTLFCEKYKMTL
ncbi:MAG: ABC transporter ATP-binding protein [Chitinophagales bacterium]|nr:ABC transporter ATP-binding protein [Chitinophagales bacterium]